MHLFSGSWLNHCLHCLFVRHLMELGPSTLQDCHGLLGLVGVCVTCLWNIYGIMTRNLPDGSGIMDLARLHVFCHYLHVRGRVALTCHVIDSFIGGLERVAFPGWSDSCCVIWFIVIIFAGEMSTVIHGEQ